MKSAELSDKSKEELIQIIKDLKNRLNVSEGKMNDYKFGANLESSRILKDRFQEIQKKNSLFSLRSFASKIGVSPGKVSDILNGQYLISRDISRKIIEQVNFSKEQEDEFLKAVEFEQSSLEDYKLFVKNISDKETFYNKKIGKIENEDEVNIMNHWTFYAILAALQLQDCKHTIAGIALKVRLSDETTESRLNTLCRLGIVKCEDEKYFLNSQEISNHGISISDQSIRLGARKSSLSAFNFLNDIVNKEITLEEKHETSDAEPTNYFAFYINAIDSSKIGNVPQYFSQITFKALTGMSESQKKDSIYMVTLALNKI